MSDCCLKGFQWDGKPKGCETKLAGRNCYITGSNKDAAVLVLHDLFGWTFNNTRLLADQYAEEIGATVYLPDLFGGEVIPPELIIDKSRWPEIDIPAFIARNSKEVREPEIAEAARELRTQHKRIGAIGFCYGGWAVFRLGAKTNPLVNAISTAHPSHLEESEIEAVSVPVQILSPEMDIMYTEELKAFSNRVIPTLGVAYDYQYFPGVEHSFALRGDPSNVGEREAMVRAKDAAVSWFRQWLK